MRLEVTRKSDLGVRALCVLSSEHRLKGSVLAKTIGTSQAFLAQVMGPLVREGWVHSEPGPHGGYSLGEDLASLSMLEVIEAIEGPTDTGDCALRGGPCPGTETCALHDAWVPARRALLDRLAATPVAIAACE
jgi:Rrf2 family protein